MNSLRKIGVTPRVPGQGRSLLSTPPHLARISDFEEAMLELDSLTNWENRDRRELCKSWSLGPIDDLLFRLDNPHKKFRTVHVAGTKGKGSVCSLIEKALVRAGFNTGRYASPHVESFTERVSLNGKIISEKYLGQALRRALSARDSAIANGSPAAHSTSFDIITAAAFLTMAEASVEWGVIECGLGGRLDSTNLVDGSIAVITNIDLEHTEILGSTKAAIASEKAGIVKHGSVLITGVARESEAGRVIFDRARELGCRAIEVDVSHCRSITDTNIALAEAVLKTLAGLSHADPLGRFTGEFSSNLLNPDIVKESALPGRLEKRRVLSSLHDVPVILDGAHVPSSLARVIADVWDQFPNRPCVAVLGVARDKDATGMIDALSERIKLVITTQVSSVAHDRLKLQQLAINAGMQAKTASTPQLALSEACRLACNGWVLVTGSLPLVGAIRHLTTD